MHLYARLHAWLHSLFKPSEAVLTREVFDAVSALMRQHGPRARERPPSVGGSNHR